MLGPNQVKKKLWPTAFRDAAVLRRFTPSTMKNFHDILKFQDYYSAKFTNLCRFIPLQVRVSNASDFKGWFEHEIDLLLFDRAETLI